MNRVPDTAAAPEELAPLLRGALATAGGRRPRVVLFGNYGNGNMGDEAILRGVLTAFGDAAAVTVMSRRPDRVQALHPGASAAPTLSWTGVRTVLRADVVAIGGGGIFGNNMDLLPRLLAFAALTLQLLGKRVVFVAIGAYRTTPRVIRAALRRVARKALLVTVRDAESAEVLAAPDTRLVPDPGGQVPAAPTAEVDAVLGPLGVGPGRLLGISLKPTVDPAHDDRQVELAVAAARAWGGASPDGTVLLLCLSDVGNFGLGAAVSDRTLSDRVAAAVDGQVRTVVVGPDVAPWVMKGVIGRCDAVVAHRLHAQLFAHDEGVPVFGLSWERKSDVFLESIGAPRIDLVTGTGDDLVGWLAGAVSVGTAV